MASYPSYSAPMVIQPTATHTHSIIPLHGCGDTGHKFGGDFSKASTSNGLTLQQLFPGMKFIFPTANLQKSTVLGGRSITQWFDVYTLGDITDQNNLQIEGLTELSVVIHSILEEEVKSVSLKNVMLGGISQGCAAALCMLLSFYYSGNGEQAGTVQGFVGLTGGMPLRKMLSIISKASDTPVNSFFGGSRANQPNVISINMTAAFFAQRLTDIGSGKSPMPDYCQVPLFLGHGEADDEVSVELASQAARILRDLGLDLTLKTYAGLGHSWRRPDEIDDIVKFLTARCGLVAK